MFGEPVNEKDLFLLPQHLVQFLLKTTTILGKNVGNNHAT